MIYVFVHNVCTIAQFLMVNNIHNLVTFIINIFLYWRDHLSGEVRSVINKS